MNVYKPREDSFLLAELVKKYAGGNVLDMGTGIGIQAVTAAEKADSVLAVDINNKAIDYCRKNIKNRKIQFSVSDLFSDVKGKFDLVIFNPPYLPDDKRVRDVALDGGHKGYEIIERFLKSVGDYLKEDGKILLLFSSFTNKKKINELIKHNNLRFKEVGKQKLDFEELYVYLIQK